ncbi:hypothetical protein [Synechococcus sp. PCC 7336]|uniref:hypothetical protein n=1 Tax=Synechococcus sp. PCC 7336 TaxID=195250 RepID=UPI000347C7A4|nr:hypothetical protein [Synechococcus sp. PCC 7336]
MTLSNNFLATVALIVGVAAVLASASTKASIDMRDRTKAFSLPDAGKSPDRHEFLITPKTSHQDGKLSVVDGRPTC